MRLLCPPDPLPTSHGLCQRRQQQGVSLAPHHARAQDDGRKAGRRGGHHGLLRDPLRRRVQPHVVLGVRRGLVRVYDGHPSGQHCFAAHVDEALHARGLRGREHVVRAVHVGEEEGLAGAPFAGGCGEVDDQAAAAHGRLQAGGLPEVAQGRLCAEGADGVCRALAARQGCDAAAALQQGRYDRSADEAGTTGDKHLLPGSELKRDWVGGCCCRLPAVHAHAFL